MSGEEMYTFWSNSLRSSGQYPPYVTIPGWDQIAQAEKDAWNDLAQAVT
jgi:hypothetical protein